MNTTEEVDDDSAGCGILCCLVFWPRPGPGLASSMYMMDWPAVLTCSAPIGVKIPWLIALLRNRTLAGSIKIADSGRRLFLIRTSTPAVRTDYIVAEDCDQHTDDTY